MPTRKSVVRLAQVICLGAVATGVAAVPAAAQPRVPCSANALSAAITQANMRGSGTLDLRPGCTYRLRAPLPEITSDLVIDANHSTITRSFFAPRFRILKVGSKGDLTLREATITNGNAPGNFGGGIANFGNLTVTDSTVRNNRADFSGGIGAVTGTHTTIIHTTVTGNRARQNGGGIANDGHMVVNRSRVDGNSAGQVGGGIANDGTLHIYRTTVNANFARRGGGIANIGGGNTDLLRSNVERNRASQAPGGILNEKGTVTLVLTRVNGNRPTNCAGSPVRIFGCRH